MAACTAALALEVRKAPAEYPVQGEASDMRVGVEYMVRTFSADQQTFSIDDYLLVEIGVFPVREANVDLRRFILRINGKNDLLAQTPGMVAASVKYPDWRRRPSVQAGLGMPGGDIIMGRRPSVERFPGSRQPGPQPVPNPTEPIGEKPTVDYEQLIKNSALPEGRMNRPLAGYAYFPYDGKLKSIKTVELLIDDVVLKLR